MLFYHIKCQINVYLHKSLIFCLNDAKLSICHNDHTSRNSYVLGKLPQQIMFVFKFSIQKIKPHHCSFASLSNFFKRPVFHVYAVVYVNRRIVPPNCNASFYAILLVFKTIDLILKLSYNLMLNSLRNLTIFTTTK